MGKILFMTPVAADAEAEKSQVGEQLRAIEKVQDLIERRDDQN